MEMEERNVLIIDPDITDRTTLAASLESEHFYVETGCGLKDAVKKVSEGCFKCVIMDVNLPEMKGYEAVSILKRIDPGIKVIMTSRKNTKGLETKIRAQDIFFYFIKSFSIEELKLAINNALSQ
jgi:DNA-binding NtrC family response regulator